MLRSLIAACVLLGFGCAFAQSKLSYELASIPNKEPRPAQILPAILPSDPVSPLESRPLSLAIDHAVVSHPSVQSKLSSTAGARAEIQAAKYQYYPTPSLITERGANETNKQAGLTSSNTLRIQQPLWAGGRLDAGLTAAQYKNVLAQLSLQETQNNVALRTLEAWGALLTALGRKTSALGAYERLERLDKMIQRRVVQQVSPQVDANLMVARLNQGKSDVIAAAAAQEAAKKRLDQWAGDLLEGRGLTLHDAQLLKTLAEAQEEAKLSLDEIKANVEQHISLQRNSVETAIAKTEVEQKKAERYPQVYARVDRTVGDTGASTFGQSTRYSDTKLFFGLQFTPGAGLALNEAIKVSLSKADSVQDDREGLRREVLQSMESDYQDYSANSEKIKLAFAARQSNEEIVDSYTRLFVAGRKSWLEVLNAARELSQAETALSDLQAAQIAVIYRLRMYQGTWAWQNQ